MFGMAVIERGKDNGLKTREILYKTYIQQEEAKGVHGGAEEEAGGTGREQRQSIREQNDETSCSL